MSSTRTITNPSHLQTPPPTPPLNADRIAKCCFKKFDSLPKTGKPNLLKNEWTVLSAILKYHTIADKLEVVSLGTGTKCLPHNRLSKTGDIINDSHAEVMARRGFVRYILEELNKIIDHQEKSTFIKFNENLKKFQINDKEYSFHFFTTHPPCGDASIFTNKTNNLCDSDNNLPSASKKLKIDQPDDYDHLNSIKNDNIGEIIITKNFTGGKLIQTNETDLMSQIIGEIRTKPGRGIRTLSVSCSDKLAKWTLLGLQGALIHSILETSIYLKTITICCNIENHNQDDVITALERAIWTRWQINDNLLKQLNWPIKPIIQIHVNNLTEFKYYQLNNRQPAPAGIVWYNVTDSNRNYEVCVAGKRQGITKKQLNTIHGRLLISKIEIFKIFLTVINKCNNGKFNEKNYIYAEAKFASEKYRLLLEFCKKNIFKKWTRKPKELNDFKIDNS